MAYPNSMVGRIDTAGGFVCTGTLVGEDLVLTASHCLHWNNGSFGWVSFRPAYSQGVAPYGVAYAKKVFYWVQNGESLVAQQQAFDYVVLQLDTKLGVNTSYAGVWSFQSSWLNQKSFQHFGYPCCDVRPCTYNCELKYTVPVTILASYSYQCKNNLCSGLTGMDLKHCAAVNGGQSGGPFWFQDTDSKYYIVGLQSTHGTRGPGTVATCPANPVQANSGAAGDAMVSLVSYARSAESS